MFNPQKLSAFPNIPRPAALSLALSGLLVLTGCGAAQSSGPQSTPSAPSTAVSVKTSDESSDGPSSSGSTETPAGKASNPEEQSTRDSSSNPSKTSIPSESSEPPENSDIWPAGTYLTGTDLPAGTYLIEQDTGMFPGKVLLTSDDSGSLSSVLDDIGFYNRLYLTIHEGEYVQFEGTARPADTAPPYKKSSETETYPSGMYLVGKDLEPGVYEISSSRTGTAGSYSISADARGNMSSFNQRSTISEPVLQVLEDGQYITLNGVVMRPQV